MKKYFLEALKETVPLKEGEEKRNEIDSLFIEKSLKFPKSSPMKIKEMDILKEFGESAEIFDPLKFARLFRLDSEIKRKAVKEERDALIKELKIFLESKNPESLKRLKEFNGIYVTYKAFILDLKNHFPELEDTLKELSKRIDVRASKKIYTDLIKSMSQSPLNPEDSIEKFVLEINSGKTDYLLDKLNVLSITLSDKSENENELFLLKNLFKFFRGMGIMPIKKMGEILEINVEGVSDGEYEGTPFTQGEIKKIKIARSGWIYRGKVISLPLYIEIKKEK